MQPYLEIAQLEAFVEVAIQQSFTRAGEVLGLTQPSVSARVQGLENALGEPLFERKGRVVRLTEAGQAFLIYAQRVLQTLREGTQALEALRHASSGRLTIGTARVIGTYALPDILKAFCERYPDVEVAIRSGRSADVQEMVLNEEVQIGFTRPIKHPDIICRHLYDEEIVLVTRPDHPFARHRLAHLHDIGHEPLILYHRDSTYYVLINNACRAAGITPNVVMELDSIEATKNFIEQGMGVSFLPRNAIKRELQMGLLVDVDIADGTRVVLPASLIYLKTRRLWGPSQAFVDVLADTYDLDNVGAALPAAAVTPIPLR